MVGFRGSAGTRNRNAPSSPLLLLVLLLLVLLLLLLPLSVLQFRNFTVDQISSVSVDGDRRNCR